MKTASINWFKKQQKVQKFKVAYSHEELIYTSYFFRLNNKSKLKETTKLLLVTDVAPERILNSIHFSNFMHILHLEDLQ